MQARIMPAVQLHTFHIPVMGLGYTIDTPLNVGRFGISSVLSIVEDDVIERMRALHAERQGERYVPIARTDVDHRARRITEYLNLLHRVVQRQVEALRAEAFTPDSEIVRYFELLPASSAARALFDRMRRTPEGDERAALERALRGHVVAGAIDVNIMTKCDRTNHDAAGVALPPEHGDAHAALRGFAQSELSSAVVFSAGMNARLYTYCESFPDFFPDATGRLKKTITLKVSDYRSAAVQGRFLARKGLWVSEFRIESGLNCGGHAFPTDGVLLGPILEEFSCARTELAAKLFAECNRALAAKGYATFPEPPLMKLTVQGGVGTAAEHVFLMERYGVDSVGWGSPFLLVPEATSVDDETLRALLAATPDDYVLSDVSPLGVPINTLRGTSSEAQRNRRIAAGRPGSPCHKKYLAFNTEFSATPICTGSRQYQHAKLKQLRERSSSPDVLRRETDDVVAKECLCEGLGAGVLLKNGLEPANGLSAVAVCPGPNLAYFSRLCSLREMVDHIYGRADVRNDRPRSHVFVNELALYVKYLGRQRAKGIDVRTFATNLLEGIAYYESLGLPDTACQLADLAREITALPILDAVPAE